MKFKLPFTSGKRKMEQQHTTESTENQEAKSEKNNPVTDELNLASTIEASEQQPLDEDPIAKLEIEVTEWKDKHMRLAAEFDNYKRRTMKERIDLIKTAGSDILIALLPVLDDFDRALKALESVENSPLKDGVLLIHNKMAGVMEQRGLKAMNSIGTEFDVDLHEAITNVPVEDPTKKGKVIDEVEKGYYLQDKVIRYAKVVVGN
ncbi:nucleotide exchange factor GrpE [soil metagenome]